MNRKLMAALAAVLLATVYLQWQGEDELLAPAGPGPVARPPQPEGRRAEARPLAPQEAVSAAMPLSPWVAEALVQGARAWQVRAHGAATDAPAGRRVALTAPMASAWAAAQPPGPPVIRPPVPTEAVVVAPPAPVAPRFPHPWVGRFNQGAVLSGPDTTWVVQAGDVIEGQWRVDRVEEHRMSLTYLPMNLPQQVVMR